MSGQPRFHLDRAPIPQGVQANCPAGFCGGVIRSGGDEPSGYLPEGVASNRGPSTSEGIPDLNQRFQRRDCVQTTWGSSWVLREVGVRTEIIGRYREHENDLALVGIGPLTSPQALSPPADGSGEGEELLGCASTNRPPLRGFGTWQVFLVDWQDAGAAINLHGVWDTDFSEEPTPELLREGLARQGKRAPARAHQDFNFGLLMPSRQSIASNSTRTASITGTTGRASKTKLGSIEQNLWTVSGSSQSTSI